MNDLPHHQESGDELDLKELLLRMWHHKFWFLTAITLFLAFAWLYLRYATPSYSSTAKIYIRDNRTGGTVNEEMIFQDLGLFSSDKNVLNEMAILKSRDLMQEVVRELELEWEWIGQGTIKSSEQYPKGNIRLDTTTLSGTFFIEAIDDERFWISEDEDEKGKQRAFGERIDMSGGFFILSSEGVPNWSKGREFTLKISTIEKAAKQYSNQLEVKRESDWATILNLSITTNSYQKSADILDHLIERYTESSLEEKNQGYQRTLRFIEERIRLLTDELGLVEQTIESFKERNQIAGDAAEAVDQITTELSELESSRERLEVQTEILNQLQEMLTDPEQPFQLLPASLLTENQRLSQLIERYNEVVLQYQQFNRNAGSENPRLQQMEATLGSLKENILNTMDRALAENRVLKRNAVENINKIKGEFSAIPQKERELLEIVRQQKIKESLYLYLLQKREEIALSISMATSNVKIIDQPLVSPAQVSPKPLQVYGIATSLGIVLPLGLILLIQMFNTKVKTLEDIKRYTSLPVVGEILQTRPGQPDLVAQGKGQAAEMFRILRTNLSFLIHKSQRPQIMVTSFESGEGKTFIAANLALSLSLTGKKVCLLGLDLRKPKLHDYFGFENTRSGLTNYIMGQSSMEEIVLPSGVNENLSVILSGAIPPNPAELLISDNFNQLLKQLEQQFDVVVWDTAPVGLVADTRSIKDQADCTLFVIKQGYSHQKAVASLSDEREDYRLNNPALVFNGIKKSSFYGYGQYRYGYGKYNKGYYGKED